MMFESLGGWGDPEEIKKHYGKVDSKIIDRWCDGCAYRDKNLEDKCASCGNLLENGGQCGGCNNWFLPDDEVWDEDAR